MAVAVWASATTVNTFCGTGVKVAMMTCFVGRGGGVGGGVLQEVQRLHLVLAGEPRLQRVEGRLAGALGELADGARRRELGARRQQAVEQDP